MSYHIHFMDADICTAFFIFRRSSGVTFLYQSLVLFASHKTYHTGNVTPNNTSAMIRINTRFDRMPISSPLDYNIASPMLIANVQGMSSIPCPSFFIPFMTRYFLFRSSSCEMRADSDPIRPPWRSSKSKEPIFSYC